MKLNRIKPEIEIPKLSVGDIVRIRSREEISRSLDSSGRCDGCLMMDQMGNYCGETFKVLKIVTNFFDEFKFKMYRSRSQLYILDGLICNGQGTSFNERCDRSCYLLWHRDWLKQEND